MSTSRSLLACLLFVLAAPLPGAGASPKAPDVSCASCLAVDGSGRVLYEREASSPRPNASTTKMVTALLVRERASLDDEVTISQTADAVGAAEVDLPRGGGYSVEELLQALLMASSNEAAVALAEHVAGSEAAFVQLMNEMAERNGWSDTFFVTSHGLDRPGHASSAEDLAAIGAELLDDPVLARIVRTREATVVGDAGATSFGNRNLLLESYRGAIGIKTGFTALAGNVLVSAAERKGTRVIAVALGSIDSFVDSAALLDYGFARLRRTVLVSEGEPLAGLVFDTAGSTSVVAGESVRGLGSPETIDVTFVPDDAVNLPVAAGEAVGVLEVRDPSGRVIASIDALAEGALESPEPSLITRAVSGLMRGVSAIFGGL